MKFSERWLREWVDPPIDTDALVHQLTMAGLEVDGVEPAAPAFNGVVIAAVRDVAPHPSADRLLVCDVDAGDGATTKVVCGAPNVTAGMKAPLARPGARLPEGLEVEQAVVREVTSHGMLCSAAELGLAETSEGLWALPEDAPLGADLRAYLELDDALIELDLTPNRGDCLGIVGVAREVGVLNAIAPQGPSSTPVEAAIDDRLPVALHAGDACPRYLGRVIRDIDARARTPLWLQERLRRSGLRSLGPVVDVTNYVMLELGQPMHAFDGDRLEGPVEVRWARADETLTLLDGTEARLDGDLLTIADQRGPVALAGVMGGAGSGVTEQTRHIFLESAHFAPEAVAGRARRYGLTSDAAHRFERGVDPALPARAMERATALLLEIVGGRAGPVVTAEQPDALPVRAPVPLRRQRLGQVLGATVEPDAVSGILSRLGMEVAPGEAGWTVTPPSFRFDIGIEADLIEEVGRIHGYERIPSHRPVAPLAVPSRPEARVSRSRIAEALVERGYQEAITYSFIDPEWQRRLDPDNTPLMLANPLSAELSVMRTSLWPGLLKAAVYNRHRQQERVRLFEFGVRFLPHDPEQPEKNTVAGVALGSREPEHWDNARTPADFYDVKGDVEAILALTGALTGQSGRSIFSATQHAALHPGQSARIRLDGEPVGWIGALHPALEREWEVGGRALLFELDLETLQRAGTVPRYAGLSRFPAVRRDLAVVVDESIPASAVRECVQAAAGEWLQDVSLFDVYRGKGVEKGRKSLALGLILQDYSRTLTDDEVDGVVARVVAELEAKLGGSLRE